MFMESPQNYAERSASPGPTFVGQWSGAKGFVMANQEPVGAARAARTEFTASASRSLPAGTEQRDFLVGLLLN